MFKFFNKLFYIIALSVITLVSAFAQLSDTVLKIEAPLSVSTIKVIDFVVNDRETIVLYSVDKELFVINSSRPDQPYKLNARLAGEKGDRISYSASYQVKQPRLCRDGGLVVAASDLDQDGKGGRFLRWDVERQKQLEEVETGQWGIGHWAVSSDGNYFVNYYFEKPGHKIPVIDVNGNKTYHIKTKYIIYTDSIFFTDNDSKLVFLGALENLSFKNKVFSFPRLEIIASDDSFEENHCVSGNYSIYCLDNDTLSFRNGNEWIKIRMPGKSILKKQSGKNKLYLAVSNKNQAFIVLLKDEKN